MTKEESYNSIVLYIQQRWKDITIPANQFIERLTEIAPYSSYIEHISKGKKKVVGISNEVKEAFEIWWKEYPGISRFEYMGKKFKGERVLKANKQVCLKLYSGIVPGMLYAKDMLYTLQVQIESIKQESYKTGQNRMQYLKSAEFYLRQKAYEPWIGEEMPEPIQKEKYQSVDTIDI